MYEVIRWISLGILWFCIFANWWCIWVTHRRLKQLRETREAFVKATKDYWALSEEYRKMMRGEVSNEGDDNDKS